MTLVAVVGLAHASLAQEYRAPEFTCERPAWPECASNADTFKSPAGLDACQKEVSTSLEAQQRYRECLWTYRDEVLFLVDNRLAHLLTTATAHRIMSDCALRAASDEELDRCRIPNDLPR